jgi:glycerate 2-kinase
VKQIVQQIFRETLASIDIRAALARKLGRRGPIIQAGELPIDLCAYREIVGIAYGKAAFAMAEGLMDILAPEFRVQGILVVPTPPPRKLPGWDVFVGGHPIPNERSFLAGQAILERLRACDEQSLVFFLLSGGGSTLVEQPLDARASLEDFQQLHHALVTCGAPIEEMNAVRKHLSATKGGRLAGVAPEAMKITFGVTDVPEGHESALASGPTLPDPTTVADAERVAREYGVAEKLPLSLRNVFERHALVETPKARDPIFKHTRFVLLLGMHDLLHCAHRATEGEGFLTLCDYSTDNWPLERAADHLLAVLAALKKANPGTPVAVIADGELSSPVTNDGVGGRNAAFVLTCVPKIAGKGITILSAGTDGIDGNSPAAGAVADGESYDRAQVAKLDPLDFLRRADSYQFFEALGDAIFTGPTGNNLRDLRILLAS